MGQNFKLLDIDINPLRDDYVLPIGDIDQSIYRLQPTEILSKSAIDFFTDMGYIPSAVLVFHQIPGCRDQVIHLDGYGVFEFAVNWVFAESTMMQWYKTKDGITLGVHPHTNPYYVAYYDNDMEPFENTTDPGPILVNTGTIPHNALNLSNTKDRWSVSIRFRKGVNCTWETAINDFAPWTIESR